MVWEVCACLLGLLVGDVSFLARCRGEVKWTSRVLTLPLVVVGLEIDFVLWSDELTLREHIEVSLRPEACWLALPRASGLWCLPSSGESSWQRLYSVDTALPQVPQPIFLTLFAP